MPKPNRVCPYGLISNRKCVSNVSISINSLHHTHMDLLSNQKHSSQEKLSLDRKQENAKVVVTEKKISQINLHFYSGQIWLKKHCTLCCSFAFFICAMNTFETVR